MFEENLKFLKSAFAIVLFLLPAAAIPQSITEKVNIDLVNVYVTALDAKGHFITDLKSDDLLLKEDGVDQSISNFTNYTLEGGEKLGQKDVPLTIAFVIDASSSMKDSIAGQEKIDIVRSAALRLSQDLRPEDQETLIAFNEYPEQIMPLGSDKSLFERNLMFLEIKGGNTALLDSIYFAMDKLKDAWGRKILVVCSDGEDTASFLRFDEVLSNLIASDITVLAFGTMALSSSSMKGRYILEKLATASGGYAFFPSSVKELDQMMEQLRQGMRSQYSLGYRSTRASADGTWRKILVQSKRAGLKLRYREGYFAK
jgi:Ca-activated chloride channel homolog